METIVLRSIGEAKVKVIKIVREQTGLGLKEAKEVVDTVSEGIEYELEVKDASTAIHDFEMEGAFAEIKVKSDRDYHTDDGLSGVEFEVYEETVPKETCSNRDRTEITEVHTAKTTDRNKDENPNTNRVATSNYYNISGEEVEITREMQNTVYYKNTMQPYIDRIDSEFKAWYKKKADCRAVYNDAQEIINIIISPIVDKGIEILNNQKVYYIDRSMMIRNYLDDCFDSFYDALEVMMDKYREIVHEQNLEREYRRARKASRGRVVGGGFGLEGALKGMAQAGAINATTGVAHSMANAIGNMGSAVAASSNKSTLYSQSKEPLKNALYIVAVNSIATVAAVIEKYTNVRFEEVDDEDRAIASAICKNYSAGRIPSRDKHRQIVIALSTNPFDLEIYKTIWNDFGDDSGDLRRMAEYFGLEINNYIQNQAKAYCEKKYQDNCKAYIDSQNSITAAVQYEGEIRFALNEMYEYCEQRKIDKKSILNISRCERILENAEKEYCTVNGICYENRSVADQIRADRKLFYDSLKGKDINSPVTDQQIKDLSFSSKLYQDNIEDIFRKEKELRNPVKIFENMDSIIEKYFPDRKTNLGDIEVGGSNGTITAKEEMIRSITSMPEKEIPIMLINNSSNGKSGILVTNYFLRTYSRGVFGTKSNGVSITKILQIVCHGESKYSAICENEKYGFETKTGLNIENQNQLGKLLEETIFTINHLLDANRMNLKYIQKDSIQCECGTYLPSNTKICPNCFKIYTAQGFKDTVKCSFCGNRVQIGKKFCSCCGNNLQDNRINESKDKESCEIIITNADSIIGENIQSGKNEEPRKKKCSYCGNPIKENGKFCSRCGKAVGMVEQKECCPKCGNEVKKGAKYCNKCGTKLLDQEGKKYE